MLSIPDFSLAYHLHAIVAVLCLLTEAACSFGETIPVDKEVINKWKSYERFSRSLQGVARKTTTADSGKIERSHIVYKQNRDCTLSCLSDEESSTEIIRIGNTHYAASIKRSKSDSTQVVLDKFAQDPYGQFPGYSGYKMSVFDLIFRGISPHFAVGAVPLSQLVVDPMYKFLKVSKELENGRELVRIDYTSLYKNQKSESQSIGGGVLFLDPSHCWCLRRIKTSSKATRNGAPVRETESEIEFEVIEHPSGFPLVKTQTSRNSVYLYKTNKRLTSTAKVEYEWKVDENVPDSEFTLSAFGLPEPGSDEPVTKPMPMYVWILVVAGVCAVLALGFRYLARRAHTKPVV